MLSISWTTIRLFLHVVAASVWVGGQLTLAGLVPTLRGLSPDAPRAAARKFNVIAWSAFAVLIVTGIWNLLAEDVGDQTTAWQASLGLKLLLVAATGHRGCLAHRWPQQARPRGRRGAVAARGPRSGVRRPPARRRLLTRSSRCLTTYVIRDVMSQR